MTKYLLNIYSKIKRRGKKELILGFGILTLLFLLLFCVFIYDPFEARYREVVLNDGYVVDGLVYRVSELISKKVSMLGAGDAKGFRSEPFFGYGSYVKLIHTHKASYIYKFKYKDKDLIFKYALYTDTTKNEVEIAREVQHENIVKTYYAFFTNDKKAYFIVTEPMDCSLSIDYAKEYPNEIKNIIRSVAQAIKYLHGINIIHCDIKLSNILVKINKGKRIYKLCDFGGSQYMYGDFVYPNNAIFTNSYGAPETYFDVKFTFSTDIWLLGHTIWFYILQRKLFVDAFGRYDDNAYNKYLKGDNQIIPNHEYIVIVKKCCNRDPYKRIGYDDIISWCESK